MQIELKTDLIALEKAKKMGAKEVLKLLDKKGVVGRGGASFPTGRKWNIALETKSDEKFVICNADEGEPGTFKDKLIIERNAETMIEGILIAAYTIGAKRCFIYLRGEYRYLRKELGRKINRMVKKSGLDVTIDVVMGAGAYICGEETAIIQSIMGHRGHAMYKPPYPPVEGLWGKPTVVNNVETLTCVSQAILFDDWDPSLRLFSLSGNVKNPGVYEFPLGIKMSKILDVVIPQKEIKAVSFGCFGGFMKVKKNMEITHENICKKDCQHGAFSMIFIDETNNIVDVSYTIAKFYTYESCGKCTPCREGTIRLLERIKQVKGGTATKTDLELLKEFAEHVQETSLCGLGQSAGNYILTGLKYFKEDYMKYIKSKK